MGLFSPPIDLTTATAATLTFQQWVDIDFSGSLRINTEMGLLIESAELNRELRQALHLDFHLRNAWHVQKHPDGTLRWVGDDRTLKSPPSASPMQRLEDWIFAFLPIEGEM